MKKMCKYAMMLLLIVMFFSCSKEEDKIPLAPVTVSSADFDDGHLLILLVGNSAVVDSIIYTNQTKGFSNKMNGLGYISANNLSIMSKPLLNGNTGDQIECCVYLNTDAEIGIAFDTAMSTLQTPMILAGKFCKIGLY